MNESIRRLICQCRVFEKDHQSGEDFDRWGQPGEGEWGTSWVKTGGVEKLKKWRGWRGWNIVRWRSRQGPDLQAFTEGLECVLRATGSHWGIFSRTMTFPVKPALEWGVGGWTLPSLKAASSSEVLWKKWMGIVSDSVPGKQGTWEDARGVWSRSWKRIY